MRNIFAVCIALLRIIGKYVIVIVLTITTMFAYAYLQLMLFGRGDYLLFVPDEFNFVLVLLVALTIIYISITMSGKFEEAEESRTEDLEYDRNDYDDSDQFEQESISPDVPNVILERIKTVLKICYVPVLLICLYWGLTNYAVLYTDTIKVSTPLNPHGRIYTYSSIESISVGLEEYRKIYTPFYEVKFHDGTSVNLFDGSTHEDIDEGFEDILIKFDAKLKAQGTRKSINKTHFDEYAQDLNKEFTRKVERLFNQ